MAVAKIYNENTGQWEAAITGPSGVIDVTSPITNTGTPTEANIGIDESALSLDGSQVSDATPTSVGVVLGSTTDAENVSLGNQSLESITTGGQNTSVGRRALQDVDTGGQNTALGFEALTSNTAAENTAVGTYAMQLNTTGNQNVAMGRNALLRNTTGASSVAVGHRAAQENTTGGGNVAIGWQALLNNQDRPNNVSVGVNSSLNLDGGADNTVVGSNALRGATTGSGNTAIGRSAGFDIDTNINNTCLGNQAQPSSGTVDHEITLGDNRITSLRCNVQSISSLSDQRDKTNIQDSPLGLDLIQRLRPVTFDWDRRDGSFAGRKDVGFIAQDVVEVEDELDIEDTLRMSYRSNPEKLEVAQARLIPVLTKAIQELSEQNAELKARLDKLEGK